MWPGDSITILMAGLRVTALRCRESKARVIISEADVDPPRPARLDARVAVAVAGASHSQEPQC